MSSELNSKKNVYAYLIITRQLIIISIFTLGLASSYFFFHGEKVSSSGNKSKSKILFESKLGKQLAFVNVQIESSEIARSIDEETEIVGYVTLLKSSNQEIQYSWALPDGVIISAGQLNGTLSSVKTEEPIEIKIKVRGFSKDEKKLISLTANTQVNENSFGNIAILSSRPEDSYEFIANQKFENQYTQTDFSSESLPKEAKIQR